ncbi:MAG: hypothetical protein OXO49_00175 [Gammaproteobacteria bacterium]|nr:hypothetical protein [Gammaproteobacteria bacterium]MDE0251401.1 hypothetical protein [Gammaproteobacteria bacterium]MDE0401916.1 hypothetical protein [Gammaproteobacteria bacterium]
MFKEIFSVLCLTIGLVLLYASISKIKDIRVFRLAIENIQTIPKCMVKGVAVIVIGTEFILGMGFTFGIFLSLMFWVSLGLMVAMILFSRLDESVHEHSLCLCFGQDGVLMKSWKSQSRMILLLVGVCTGLIFLYVLPEPKLVSFSTETLLAALVLLLLLSWMTDIGEVMALTDNEVGNPKI